MLLMLEVENATSLPLCGLDYNAAILSFFCVITAFFLIPKGLAIYVKVQKDEDNAQPAQIFGTQSFLPQYSTVIVRFPSLPSAQFAGLNGTVAAWTHLRCPRANRSCISVCGSPPFTGHLTVLHFSPPPCSSLHCPSSPAHLRSHNTALLYLSLIHI